MSDSHRERTGPPSGPPGDRYGRAGRRRHPALIPAAAVLLAAGVAFAGYGAWSTTQRHPTAKVGVFQTSDEGVEVTVTIRRDPGRRTECALRARNEAGAEVGRRILSIPPGGERRVTLKEFLETSERPVTGEVRDCRSVG